MASDKFSHLNFLLVNESVHKSQFYDHTLFTRTASRNGERMNNVRGTKKNSSRGRSVNSFRNKSTVATRRGIVSFGKRCGKKKKRNFAFKMN